MIEKKVPWLNVSMEMDSASSVDNTMEAVG